MLVTNIRAPRVGDRHAPALATGLVSVIAVTFANGGDNISLYTPAFRIMGPADTAITIAVFAARAPRCGAWPACCSPATSGWSTCCSGSAGGSCPPCSLHSASTSCTAPDSSQGSANYHTVEHGRNVVEPAAPVCFPCRCGHDKSG